MTTKTADQNVTLSKTARQTNGGRPILHQRAQEIQPFGTIYKLPIALEESACAASVELLNQVLAGTMTLRDMYKKHHWQVAGEPSISFTCFSTNTTMSK